ncbi:hypothetical protein YASMINEVIRUS_1005 [Yasminevirus sp. GU-2018]|uniref:Uncharacterized protein n=1 Tax=Yasminevirus sp. GU-2018 TaxID=2420051 RepID=A0A5K0UAL2_9VIRU|nr:hypothetical protein YASMINEVIRUS_1005 [Yasminevirus sp. GU-2018]
MEDIESHKTDRHVSGHHEKGKKNKCCDNDCDDICDNALHPICPLKLMRHIDINPDNTKSIYLLNVGDPQKLVFKCANFLSNKSLLFVIPKCIVNECCEAYTLTLDPEVIIHNANTALIPVQIFVLDDGTYIKIPVTETMIVNCDLILYVNKIKINLTPADSCTTNNCDNAWRWIPSDK